MSWMMKRGGERRNSSCHIYLSIPLEELVGDVRRGRPWERCGRLAERSRDTDTDALAVGLPRHFV